MSTSASMTKRIVSTSSLPERPTRHLRRGDATGAVVSNGSGPGSKTASTENSEIANDAPQQRPRQTRQVVLDCRPLADLGQGRIRHDEVGEAAHGQSLPYRQAPGGNQFSRLCADNAGAENATLFVDDDLDVTVRRALGLGAVIVVIGPAQDADRQAPRPRLRFGKTGLRQLRLGEGHVRNGGVVGTHRQPEQRVADDETGLMVTGMREPRLPGGNVADGIDAAIARLEFAVHLDAGRVIADACGIEPEAVEHRLAPGGDEKMRAADVLFLAVGFERDGKMADGMRDAQD